MTPPLLPRSDGPRVEPATAPPGASDLAAARLRAVHRAAADLRRGIPVVLEGAAPAAAARRRDREPRGARGVRAPGPRPAGPAAGAGARRRRAAPAGRPRRRSAGGAACCRDRCSTRTRCARLADPTAGADAARGAGVAADARRPRRRRWRWPSWRACCPRCWPRRCGPERRRRRTASSSVRCRPPTCWPTRRGAAADCARVAEAQVPLEAPRTRASSPSAPPTAASSTWRSWSATRRPRTRRWCACIRNASPATCWAACAATAARSCAARSPAWPRRAPACCCISRRRGAASGWSTSCAPTRCRTAGWIRWTPTARWAGARTSATS